MASPSSTTTSSPHSTGLAVRRVVARLIDELIVLVIQAGALLVAAVLQGLSQLAADDSTNDIDLTTVAIVAIGWATSVLYEIALTRGGATIGKSITGLQVLDAERPQRLSWCQCFIRWLLVAAVQPLIWLTLLLGGNESTQARILIAAVLGASLLWRATLGVSMFASAGNSSIHDRAARSAVMHTRR